MAETLSVTDMLPNKFEPKRGYRWVLAIEGIDAFLMSTAARPSLSIGSSEIRYINRFCFILINNYFRKKFLFFSIFCLIIINDS